MKGRHSLFLAAPVCAALALGPATGAFAASATAPAPAAPAVSCSLTEVSPGSFELVSTDLVGVAVVDVKRDGLPENPLPVGAELGPAYDVEVLHRLLGYGPGDAAQVTGGGIGTARCRAAATVARSPTSLFPRPPSATTGGSLKDERVGVGAEFVPRSPRAYIVDAGMQRTARRGRSSEGWRPCEGGLGKARSPAIAARGIPYPRGTSSLTSARMPSPASGLLRP